LDDTVGDVLLRAIMVPAATMDFLNAATFLDVVGAVEDRHRVYEV